MPGGVDSSVTAKLMVDQVGCVAGVSLAENILTSFTDSRVMTLLGCSCGTGLSRPILFLNSYNHVCTVRFSHFLSSTLDVDPDVTENLSKMSQRAKLSPTGMISSISPYFQSPARLRDH